MEKFLHSCPRELALFIRERSPSDKKQLLELAKIFLPQLGLQLEEVISHSSLTAMPKSGRKINPYLTDPIMSLIGTKIRGKGCVTYVDSPAIERYRVQLGDQEGMMTGCDNRFKGMRLVL